jgi:Zn-dependent peptidase ImmA (M78 family)
VYKRGFKSWCENTSAALRTELKLAADGALDPRKLANHLDIVVWKLEEIPGIPPECVAVLRADSDSWSAATVCVHTRHAVILNSEHSPARMNSDFMHELSHLVLAHTPARVDVSGDQLLLLSSYNRAQEEEANWLSGALLLPRDALFNIRRKQLTDQAACRLYGCSQDMLTFRFRVTAVDLQLKRSRPRVVGIRT